MKFKIQSINCDVCVLSRVSPTRYTRRCENRSTFIKVTFPTFPPTAYFKLMLLEKQYSANLLIDNYS